MDSLGSFPDGRVSQAQFDGYRKSSILMRHVRVFRCSTSSFGEERQQGLSHFS